MKIAGLLWKAAVAVLFVSALAPLSWGAGSTECRDVPGSQLQVSVAKYGVLNVIPATRPVMAGASDDQGVLAEWKAQPLVLIAPHFASQVSMDERTSPGDGGNVCATPKKIRIRLGISDYLVYIYKKAYADECVRRVLIQYATTHLAGDNEAIAAFVVRHRDVIAKQVPRLKRMAYPNEQAAVANFKAGLSEMLVFLFNEFLRERTRAFADGHRSFEQKSETACNGRFEALEADARFQGEHADASNIPASKRVVWLDGMGSNLL